MNRTRADDHVPPGDLLAGLIPGQARQGTGQHDGDPGQRPRVALGPLLGQDDTGGPPLVHDRGMPVHLEPVDHRSRDGRADPVHSGEPFGGRAGDQVQRAELGGQRAGRGRAHVPDGQRDQEPPQRAVPRLVQVAQQHARVDLERALLVDEERDPGQAIGGHREQVALVGHQPRVEQRGEVGFAHHDVGIDGRGGVGTARRGRRRGRQTE